MRLSYVARVGTYLVGANRMTHIRCGEAPILLLGPLSVEPAFRSSGIGEALVTKSLDAARAAGHRLVILVGDLAYYQRMGFRSVPEGLLIFPGPVDPARLLYCPLTEDGLDTIGGRVRKARPHLSAARIQDRGPTIIVETGAPGTSSSLGLRPAR